MGHAYILDAVRTPRGKGKASGRLHETHPQELLATCLKALGQRVAFDPKEVEDVVAGCVPEVIVDGLEVVDVDHHRSNSIGVVVCSRCVEERSSREQVRHEVRPARGFEIAKCVRQAIRHGDDR